MSNYNETEETCNCMTCDLVEEFSSLIKENVDWESALRHVLGVAMNASDEFLTNTVDEAYNEGLVDGIRRSADLLIDIADDIEGISPDDANNNTEKVEDLTDEEFEELQGLLLKSIRDSQ